MNLTTVYRLFEDEFLHLPKERNRESGSFRRSEGARSFQNRQEHLPEVLLPPALSSGMEMNMKRTLVIGSAVCDIVIPLEHLPSRSEDINFYHQELSLGGCAFNVCDCLRHFEVPFVPFLPVGSGIYGQFVKEQLEKRGIVSFCPPASSENGCCYCLVEADGERTFLCYHGAEYLFEEDWFAMFENSPLSGETDSVYVCGLEIEERTGERVLAFLERHRNMQVFFAPSSRICMIQPERMRRMLDLHPVLHLNEEEAVRFTGCESVTQAGRKLSSMTGSTTLVTCGRHGCFIFDKEGGSLHVEAFPSTGKGDAIGAGDSHIGSVIALLRKGLDMEAAVRGANRVAAAVAGTRGALLTDEQFRQVMAEGNR